MAAGFQLTMDGGYQKAMANVTAWFVRVTALPSFVRSFGSIKLAAKLMKPAIKLAVKEKPKAVEKKVAPKPKAADDDEEPVEKKEVNPLDALPPSSFDLFNFKTFFVNHKDKKGEAIDEMLKIFDPEGYSFYYLQYEKFGNEGQVLFKTTNLCKGFLQRFDGFRKHAFARHCVIGDEPNLEIEGVWLWRGQGIPQEAIDHPQFEYYKNRKLDVKNADDVALIREFWGA
jgi:elongation factor 1-gamma